ncbi:pantothenate synthetase [mine drainage metagenome]|uniref:pantoate--beta-alanine ligase (AMP-forming) n=1 Tax=mine drainage metagenome TaxID=410659 RepID=A0A1J5TAP6_9ZZZZ
MNKFTTAVDMQQSADAWRTQGRRIALVPTSGSLHAGHLAMIREARKSADVVVVSIFVNPLQFAANEGFAGYPRHLESDLALCEQEGADAVFAPATEEIYPKGYSTYVVEELVAKPLCGISRPSHFRGITTLYVNLLNLVHPQLLVLGQKDAQMVAVVRKMIADLHFKVDITVIPIARESDGIACHVRNADLTTNQRQDAIALHRALVRAKEMADSGVKSVDRVVAEVTHILRQQRRVRVIYISVVDPSSMEPMREIVPGSSLLAIAAWVDEVRLTDNALL